MADTFEELIRRLKGGYSQIPEACEALGKLGDARAVKPLIKCLGHWDSDVQRAASEALGKLVDARAVEPLIESLGDSDSKVRRAACEALGKLGDARAVEPLIECSEKDLYSDVQRAAGEALGGLVDAMGVEPLIKCLGSSSPWVWRSVFVALARCLLPDPWLKSRRGQHLIWSAWRTCPDSGLAENLHPLAADVSGGPVLGAITGLGWGYLGAVLAGFLCLVSFNWPLWRSGGGGFPPAATMATWIFAGLVVAGGGRWIAWVLGATLSWRRWLAGFAADSTDEPSFILIALVHLLLTTTAILMLVAARVGLGRGQVLWGFLPAWIPFLLGYVVLAAVSAVVQSFVLAATIETELDHLVRSPIRALFLALVAALLLCFGASSPGMFHGWQHWGCLVLAWWLGVMLFFHCSVPRPSKPDLGAAWWLRSQFFWWPRASLANGLLRVIEDDAQSPVLAWAPQSLIVDHRATLGDRQAVEPLIERLRHPRLDVWLALRAYWDGPAERVPGWALVNSVRRAACEALGKLGDARAVEPLIERLRDSDSDVRRAACEALRKLGDASAVEPLIERLADSDSDVRCAAREAIARLGDPIMPLLRQLRHGDRNVRRAVCGVLGELGDATAVEPLIERLRDSDSDVQRAACRALGRLGQPRVMGPLADLAKDSDSEVQHSATAALARLSRSLLADPRPKSRLDPQVIWRAWRNCPDSAVAENLHPLAADVSGGPVLGTITGLGWGYLGAVLAGFLCLVSFNWPLWRSGGGGFPPAASLATWIFAGLVAAGSIRWIAWVLGANMSWRRWLAGFAAEPTEDFSFLLIALVLPLITTTAILMLVAASLGLGHGQVLWGFLPAWILFLLGYVVLAAVSVVGQLFVVFVTPNELHRLVCSPIWALLLALVAALLLCFGASSPGMFHGWQHWVCLVLVWWLGVMLFSHCSVPKPSKPDLGAAWRLRSQFFWWRQQPVASELLCLIEDAAGSKEDAATGWNPVLERTWLISSQDVESIIADLRASTWQNRFTASYALMLKGGEAIAKLADEGNDVGSQTVQWIVEGIGVQTRSDLAKARFLCADHFLPCGPCRAMVRGRWLEWVGCPVCHQSRNVIRADHDVVAVLDTEMTARFTATEEAHRVNWFRLKTPFEFNRVEIVRADGRDVEQFVMRIGNDPDRRRRKRYRKMECKIAAGCVLPDNALRLLKEAFNVVRVQNRKTEHT